MTLEELEAISDPLEQVRLAPTVAKAFQSDVAALRGRAVRKARSSGLTWDEIADAAGVSKVMVYRIANYGLEREDAQ